MGAGQCGLNLLAEILQKQPRTRIFFEQIPVLPWLLHPGAPGIHERMARWKKVCSESILGDVASFYLPYVEEAFESDAEPTLKVICLKRPRSEVIAAFVRHLDATCHVPTNHWSENPSTGWFHDPLWTHAYPQYATTDREEGIGLYWDEYYQRSDRLAEQYPDRFLLIDTEELTSLTGVHRLLDFVGIPEDRQVPVVGQAPSRSVNELSTPPSSSPAATAPHRKDCVVLVPYNGFIHAECEEALKELERRGYTVRRVGGYAAIDQGRNQMATDALVDGFAETLWIDADVGFHPDDVERLRAHSLPIVSAIYPQKNKRALASHVLADTKSITFGEGGGLIELLYAATGFLLVRREAYLTIQRKLQLPMCNERFGRPLIPFFLPMVRTIDDGHWYLAEDYSFCERARMAGFKIYAYTSIRLWHIGLYRYGWEDAGIGLPRFNAFTLNLSLPGDTPPSPPTGSDPLKLRLEQFSAAHRWPTERPAVPVPPERNWLFEGTRRALSETVPRESRLIVEVGSWLGRSTRFLCDLAPAAHVIAIDHWQGSPEHTQDAELQPLLPRLYETFLSESWKYRSRIIPVRASSVDGLRTVAAAGLSPDLVYLDADHSCDSVTADLVATLDLFPHTRIVGDDWNWDGVRLHRFDQASSRPGEQKERPNGSAEKLMERLICFCVHDRSCFRFVQKDEWSTRSKIKQVLSGWINQKARTA